MASVLERLESLLTQPNEWSRRRFIGRVIKASAGLVAMAAGLRPIAASALWCPCQGDSCNGLIHYGCCCLAHNPGSSTCCSNERRNWEWWCQIPGRCQTWVCGECYDCGTSYAYIFNGCR